MSQFDVQPPQMWLQEWQLPDAAMIMVLVLVLM